MIENKTTGLVAKANLERLCRHTLKRVQEMRAERRKEVVEKRMKEANAVRSFLGFVWKVEPVTYEQVEAGLKADKSLTGALDYHFIDHYYEKSEDTALRLQRLCRHTVSEELYVTAEDLDQLYEPPKE